jgi:hypothetical protein
LDFEKCKEEKIGMKITTQVGHSNKLPRRRIQLNFQKWGKNSK